MADDHISLWQKCLAYFSQHLAAEQYDKVFRVITSERFADGVVTINVPSPYFVELLEERYMSLIEQAFAKYYPPGTRLAYQYVQVAQQPDTTVKQLSSKPSAAAGDAFRRPAPNDISPNLNAVYTFDNYCPSDCNKVPLAIAHSIADNPSCKTFNPLFVFGSTGVGKTHLIQAIGLRLKEQHPEMRVLYVTARLFETQFTTATHAGKINDFFSFYQSIDTLIIDDVQDIAKKPSTQNTFFHIFNHLHQNQKQIIMSSDCAPADMAGFEERLLSRFKWGVAARLDKPDLQLRRQVLRLKSQQDGLELPDDIIEYLAQGVTDSVRELEGVTLSLITHAMALKRPINVELARMVMAQAVNPKQRELTIDSVIEHVCEYYDLDPDTLITKVRRRPINDARQIVMYLTKRHTRLSLKTIGTQLRRDHSTVVHACKAIADRLAVEPKLQNDIRLIEQAMCIQ